MHEVEATLGGRYGPFLATSSFLVEATDRGRPVCATLVTWWRDAPLLAFVMTHPDAKGQGMATYLVRHTVNALVRDDYHELYLAVTQGNVPAQRVYERLGFVVVP